MSPPKSKAWKYFEKLENPNLIRCKLCFKKFKTPKNTTNMTQHLNAKHPDTQEIKRECTTSSDLSTITSGSGNTIPDKNESFTSMSRQSGINDDIQAVNPTLSRSSQQIHQRSIFPELAENQIQETNSLLKYAVVKNNEVKEDECDLYAKILAEKLRKIPEFERDLLMHDINGMVIRTIHRSRLPASAASYSSNQPSNFSLSSSLLSRPSSAETGFDENTQDQMDHRTRNCEAISQAILKTSEVLHIPPEQSEILFRWKL